MRHRRLAFAAPLLLLLGCGSIAVTTADEGAPARPVTTSVARLPRVITTTVVQSSVSVAAPGPGRLTKASCGEAALAHLELVSATTRSAANDAASRLKAFELPPAVAQAIQVLARAPGVQADDPATGWAADVVDSWYESSCS